MLDTVAKCFADRVKAGLMSLEEIPEPLSSMVVEILGGEA